MGSVVAGCCTFDGLRTVYSATMGVEFWCLRFVVGCLLVILDFVVMFIFVLVIELCIVFVCCSDVLLWVGLLWVYFVEFVI